MDNSLLIIGAGGFGRVTLEHARNSYICSFIDDAKAIGEEVDGVMVVGETSDLPQLFGKYNKIVIAIGENKAREAIYKQAKQIGYVFPKIICKSAYISPYAHVGDGCIILNNVVIQNGSKVGSATILNPGVEIHHDSIVGDFCCVYTNSVIRTLAKVESGIRIGSNVTVRNEAVVVGDISDGAIV